MSKLIFIIVLFFNSISLLPADYIITHYSKYTGFAPSWWTENDPLPKSWQDHLIEDQIDKQTLISEITNIQFHQTFVYQDAIISHIYNKNETGTLLKINNLTESKISFSLKELCDIIKSSHEFNEPQEDSYQFIIIFKLSDSYSVLYLDIENDCLYYISKNGYYSGKI